MHAIQVDTFSDRLTMTTVVMSAIVIIKTSIAPTFAASSPTRKVRHSWHLSLFY